MKKIEELVERIDFVKADKIEHIENHNRWGTDHHYILYYGKHRLLFNYFLKTDGTCDGVFLRTVDNFTFIAHKMTKMWEVKKRLEAAYEGYEKRYNEETDVLEELARNYERKGI